VPSQVAARIFLDTHIFVPLERDADSWCVRCFLPQTCHSFCNAGLDVLDQWHSTFSFVRVPPPPPPAEIIVLLIAPSKVTGV
jgi:hypothetical protein